MAVLAASVSFVPSQSSCATPCRYNVWMVATVIVTLHLLVFTYMNQMENHTSMYNCMSRALRQTNTLQSNATAAEFQEDTSVL